MTPSELLQKVRSKGLKRIVAHLDPWRAYYRRRNLAESVSLRNRLLSDLARIWCGQEDDVAQLRAGMLSDVLQRAGKSIPYYRTLFETMEIDNPRAGDLALLPLLDKVLVRQHKKRLCSPGWQRRAHYRMNTGGSTGEPLEFIVDSLAGVAAAAHQEFVFRLMGYRDGDRIAAFSGASVADESRLQKVFWSPRPNPTELPYGSVCYASHYMDASTQPFYFENLNQCGFSFFLGYPSAIHTLARYCLETGRRFSRPIKAVQLTSEVVLDSQIAEMESAFQAKVYLQYGMSEACVYAHTFDASGEYLCSPLMGWVEVLDQAGRHVRVGEEGEVVVTGFHSQLMPFVRYRTGDRAVYGGERQGMVVLRKVLGRTQDYLVRTNGTRLSLTGLVFGQHFRAFANIARWQIVQDEPGACAIWVVPLPGFGKADRNEITEKFRRLGDIDAAIKVVGEIPLTARGKHLFLVQNIQDRAQRQ